MGGLSVNAKGNMAVSDHVPAKIQKRNPYGATLEFAGSQRYQPLLYPGRRFGGKRPLIHVYDKHGKVLFADAMPGLGIVHGVKIDADNNLYVGGTAPVTVGGKPYFNDMTGTVIKAPAGKARLLVADKTPIPLTKERRPDRPRDVKDAWIENADWVFGGVGWAGNEGANRCDCVNIQFDLDYLKRTFVPEVDRYSVAVLDANGNVICRIGRYGNVDEGKPLVAEGGPENAKPIGGDEVTLFHGAHLAVHTDKRLFIADTGNRRVVSVKLDYHVSESVPLGKIEKVERLPTRGCGLN
jgi:hypothetical protein